MCTGHGGVLGSDACGYDEGEEAGSDHDGECGLRKETSCHVQAVCQKTEFQSTAL